MDRKILLDRLEYIGINRKVHRLLKSYLTGRIQFVSFGGYESDWKGMEIRVTQDNLYYLFS